MKVRNINRRWAARKLLRAAAVPLDQDFHALGSEAVEVILAVAQVIRFKKPDNASGSYAREFYEFAQRDGKECDR